MKPLVFRYEPSFDFPDIKGWDVYLGNHCEGQILWRSRDFEDVLKGDCEPGFVCVGFNAEGEPFATLEECQQAFESHHFPQESARWKDEVYRPRIQAEYDQLRADRQEATGENTND